MKPGNKYPKDPNHGSVDRGLEVFDAIQISNLQKMRAYMEGETKEVVARRKIKFFFSIMISFQEVQAFNVSK